MKETLKVSSRCGLKISTSRSFRANDSDLLSPSGLLMRPDSRGIIVSYAFWSYKSQKREEDLSADVDRKKGHSEFMGTAKTIYIHMIYHMKSFASPTF